MLLIQKNEITPWLQDCERELVCWSHKQGMKKKKIAGMQTRECFPHCCIWDTFGDDNFLKHAWQISHVTAPETLAQIDTNLLKLRI